MSATAAGFAARRLARHAEAHGVSRETVASWLGVGGEDLDSPPRIPIERLYRAWASASRALGDPAIGVRCALGWTVADLELFGFCVATAPTAGDAAGTAVRYAALVTDSGHWRLDAAERGQVSLSWNRSGPSTLGRSVSNEVAVASFAVCFRELTGTSPIAVDLRHRPAARAPVHRDLLGCPVRFGCPTDRVVIARADLDIVPRQANPALWRFLSAIADGEVAAVRPRSASARVARALVSALDSDLEQVPSAGAIARSLGLSERTLRRRLRGEVTSFRALVDQVRRARAAELLADEAATVTEVAAAAGFADASGLGHAWRRWFGASPTASRRGDGPGDG